MSKVYKIPVVLAMLSLLVGMNVFNNVLFAVDSAKVKEAEPDFVNVSFWPQSFQDFLRFELIYGDRKIDELEAKYLVNSVFQSQGKTEESKLAHNIQSIAAVLTILPSDSSVKDTFISQVTSKTGYSREQVKKLLDKELEKNRSEMDSVKSICEDIVSKGGNVTLDKNKASDMILYQLLQTKGITGVIYSKLVIGNQLDINEALEILKLANRPEDYVFEFTKTIFKDSDATSEKFKLAELSEYMSDSGANKLIDMLFETIPHYTNQDGTVTYKVRNVGMESTLQTILGFTQGHVRLHNEYLNAQKNGKLSDFFSTRSLPAGQLYGDKAWLLFRYHPDLVWQLADIYIKSSTPANYDKGEIKSVFSSLLPYGEIVPEQVSSLIEVKNLVISGVAPNTDTLSGKLIREAVGKQLKKDPNTLTDEDYQKIQNISLTDRNISDITLLVNLTNLRELSLGILQIHDIYVLTHLANLQSLNLNGTQINDISALANLTSLQSLRITNATQSDINLLSGIPGLKSLFIMPNQPVDIRPLEKLANLQYLFVPERSIRREQLNELEKALPNLKVQLAMAR